MAKNKSVFVCQECGYEAPKWFGKCPGCNTWNSMVEEKKMDTVKSKRVGITQNNSKPESILNIKSGEFNRYDTGIGELNRVLGGGLVKGSLTLISGAPGIGKSTILLQTANNIATKIGKVLYVSGEESGEQIKIRGDRIGNISSELYILSETNLEIIEEHINSMNPVFVRSKSVV